MLSWLRSGSNSALPAIADSAIATTASTKVKPAERRVVRRDDMVSNQWSVVSTV